MEFGQRLKEVRKQNSLSQVELAKMLGFHSITVSRWERSVDYPGIIVLVQLARLFGVSTDYLLGLSITMKNSLRQERNSLMRNAPPRPRGWRLNRKKRSGGLSKLTK
jgi:transcriptional regulator with XRE-family HTH domain